jgi:hypothetical protein
VRMLTLQLKIILIVDVLLSWWIKFNDERYFRFAN